MSKIADYREALRVLSPLPFKSREDVRAFVRSADFELLSELCDVYAGEWNALPERLGRELPSGPFMIAADLLLLARLAAFDDATPYQMPRRSEWDEESRRDWFEAAWCGVPHSWHDGEEIAAALGRQMALMAQEIADEAA